MNSRRCGLIVNFLHSHKNQPDPITEIAMKDIRAQGLREFVDRCRVEQVRAAGGSDTGDFPTTAQIENWVQEHVASDYPQPQPPAAMWKLKAGNFKRVVFCETQWPNLADDDQHLGAINKFEEVSRGLERAISWCEARIADNSPFKKLHVWTRSRLNKTRYMRNIIPFLRVVVDAFRSRRSVITNDSVECGNQSTEEFRPSSVEARALLWFYLEPRDLESKLIRRCARLLKTYGAPEGRTYAGANLFEKFFETLFVPHLIFFRAIEVSIDIVQLLSSQDPTQILHDIPYLIRNSALISLHFHIEGSLERYSDSAGDSSYPLSQSQTEKRREWMEAVVKSEGLLLACKETRKAIDDGLYH
jgi:hypothetical protein